MGAAFVSQQYLQNVLGYSTLEAGAAILPAVVFMVLVAPRSAKLVEAAAPASRCCAAMCSSSWPSSRCCVLWKEGSSYWEIALAYIFMGMGVGFAGTPASHSLTGSVPVRRAGMASGTADLQRDLGGAIMQSIFGALLTAGYAAAAGSLILELRQGPVRPMTQAELTKSFSSAADTASRYRQMEQQALIISGAKTAFLQGDQWAYTAGIVAVVLGAAIVFFLFPKARRRAAPTRRIPRAGHARLSRCRPAQAGALPAAFVGTETGDHGRPNESMKSVHGRAPAGRAPSSTSTV